MTLTIRLVAFLLLVAAARTAAQTDGIGAWRAAHERQILDELIGLVAIPNVAGNAADMQRNAAHLVALFEKRGFTVERTEGTGSPVVFASLDVPAPRGTIVLYIHYDGQPVDPAEWTRCKPFAPCIYDDVTPLAPSDLAALDEMPNVEAALKKDFLVAQPERPEQRLERKLNEPTLSVLAMEAGGGFDVAPRSAIPATAAARIEMRLVNGLDPATMNRRVVDHVKAQGYFLVEGRDPTDAERLTHPLLARADLRGGSAAPRVSMEAPLARAVVAALQRNGRQLVRLPTLGGSMPFATFSERMPTIGFSMVNHDNNQHGPDENLRLRNLWEGVEMMAAIMTMNR